MTNDPSAVRRPSRSGGSRTRCVTTSGARRVALTLAAIAVLLPAHAATAQGHRVQPWDGASQGAWDLPEPDALIHRVLQRIVTQDRPGALPVADYDERRIGRQETIEAVRRFARQPVTLAPSAFRTVAQWSDARRADAPVCPPGSPGCAVARSALWIAVTQLERGDLPHELHVWYATRFAASATGAPEAGDYEFCERWLRVRGTWRYDGFVTVRSVAVAP